MSSTTPESSAASTKRLYRLCPFCGTRLARNRRRCDCGRKLRKSRAQARVRPVDDYSLYLDVAREAHGVTDESCCICGRPKPQHKRHDREHDHKTGLPRGVVCFRCNKELLRHADLEQARQVVAYLERVEAFYALPRN